jgi:hypothetical protein
VLILEPAKPLSGYLLGTGHFLTRVWNSPIFVIALVYFIVDGVSQARSFLLQRKS